MTLARGFYAANERSIWQTLKALARQQCVGVAAGNTWMIQNGPENSEQIRQDLHTCYMRGWVEPISGAVPTFGPHDVPGDGYSFAQQQPRPFYRLTDSGWAVLHRTRLINLLGVWVSAFSLGVAVASIVLQFRY